MTGRDMLSVEIMKHIFTYPNTKDFCGSRKEKLAIIIVRRDSFQLQF